jgi:uncharacterized protein (DUF305 family)
LIRTQTTIGDRRFLRSMIPHHSGAIPMCSEALPTDPEIVALCRRVERSQAEEIDETKAILARGRRERCPIQVSPVASGGGAP